MKTRNLKEKIKSTKCAEKFITKYLIRNQNFYKSKLLLLPLCHRLHELNFGRKKTD